MVLKEGHNDNVEPSVEGSWLPGWDAHPLQFLYALMACKRSRCQDAFCGLFNAFTQINMKELKGYMRE